jgi:hypothetical protein
MSIEFGTTEAVIYMDVDVFQTGSRASSVYDIVPGVLSFVVLSFFSPLAQRVDASVACSPLMQSPKKKKFAGASAVCAYKTWADAGAVRCWISTSRVVRRMRSVTARRVSSGRTKESRLLNR